MDYQMHHRVLIWLETAAKELRTALKGDELAIKEKTSSRDLVTEMDRKTEEYFIQNIRNFYPDHQIIAEEGLGDAVTDTKGIVWVIDPIDGTLNFVKAKNHFAIMIGIFEDGNPMAGYIYDVMPEKLYYGIVGEGAYVNDTRLEPERYDSISDSLIVGNAGNFARNVYNMEALARESLGIRYYGSSALEVIAVIRGEASLYFSAGINSWDFAAGYAICTAMGFPTTDHKGNKLNILEKTPVLFAHPNVHQEALNLLNQRDRN